MRNILIVGGTGVLSSAMVSEALKQGHSVTIINRGSKKSPEGVECIVTDKENHNYIAERLNGRFFDAVIDFLCYDVTQLRSSFSFYSNYTRQYIFISSCAVYAPQKEGFICEDSAKPNHVWKYSVDKWECEKELKRLSCNSSCKYTVIRPAVTYGDSRIPYGISPRYGYHWTLAARILAGKPILTWDGGCQRTMALRVEDFSIGAMGLVGNPKAYGEAFNICADYSNSYNEVLDAIASFVGKPVVTCDISSEFYARLLPERAGEILGGRTSKPGCSAKLSNAKIKGIVPSFGHRIVLTDGVRMTLEAYKKQNFQKGIDWEFDGDTDRIIRAWLRRQNENPRKYNTGFVDYLHNATYVDKYRYWRTLNRDNMLVGLVMKAWRVVRKFI